MKFLSQIMTTASGSVGGLTASRNKGGLYFRARVIPVNPQTSQQSAVRNALTQLVDAWTNTLGQGQRNGWNVYAENVPVTDALGQTISLSGQQHFLRSNVPRLQTLGTGIAGAIVIAPSIFNTGEVDSSAFFSIVSPGTITYTFDVTLDWLDEDDSFLVSYWGLPQNNSIKFFKGPYQLGDRIDGDAITPPTSPAAQVAPRDYAVGQRAFAYSRISRADGRLSAKFVLPDKIVSA